MSPVRYKYQTVEFEQFDIHFRALRDRQQYDDEHGEADDLGISTASWPLFGMIWPSGEVLAKLMASYDIDSRRVLEMGCGIGLASLVLNEREADISATDIHPRAGDFLQHNTQLNNGKHIPFFRTSWIDNQIESHGIFDLLIGSDLLYEPDHPRDLALFVKKYAKPRSEVIVVEGGRGYSRRFKYRMEALGFSVDELAESDQGEKVENFKGKILQFRR